MFGIFQSTITSIIPFDSYNGHVLGCLADSFLFQIGKMRLSEGQVIRTRAELDPTPLSTYPRAWT